MGDPECHGLVPLLPLALTTVAHSAILVFNKLIVTTLKYTPVVLAQLVPFKETNGK